MRGMPRYTLVWGARYTLGARYLSKNTVTCFWEMLYESRYATTNKHTNRTEHIISCHGTGKFLMTDTNYNYTPAEGLDCVSLVNHDKN